MADSDVAEFLLKILSGNHQGAEVIFGCETAVIGSEKTSDVVLSDSLIEPKHIEITFSKDGTTVKPLGGKVFVDGKLVKEETAKVEEFQFITIGCTHIVVGPANQQWPAISAADAPQIEGNGEPKESTEKPEIDDKIPEKVGALVKPKKKKTWLYGGGILVIFAFAIALLLFISVFSEPEKVREKPDTAVLLQNVIREMGLASDVRIDKTPTGFSVSGYTASNEQLLHLRNRLVAIDQTVKRKVYSEEKILSEISVLLSQVESHPKVQIISNGVFLISGYANDKDKWNKVRKRIIEDVPGIIDLQDEVILPQKAFNLARPVIAKYKLTGKIGVIPQADGIAIGGLVSSDEEENWKMAKIQLEKIFGSDILLKNFVKISDPEVIRQQYFGSEVNSVSISESGMNWIGFKDGTRYMEGATLSNGYSIKEITPENIVLTKGAQTIILKLVEL
ncbi:MAG: type III secretion system inner membrane ring subunit SctD [Puniceicoccales bacterium]|jgi:type III secretion system YscD/HrpQ family protein|nr:type III secretion system inner membrane ring subunit SctD [Puniceicoccales bacterium]